MLRHASILKLSKRMQHAAAALLFLFAYTISMIGPFVPIVQAAAGDITISDTEGQNSDGTWTPGNTTQYKEGDTVNYRFKLTSSNASAAGNMLINFGANNCVFFDNYFKLLSVVSTPTADVVTNGSVVGVGNPVSGNLYEDYYQELGVQFHQAGSVIVTYQIRLSLTAGECNGSSSHMAYGNAEVPGDFGNIGNKTIPSPADVWILPSITLHKQVADGIAEAKDFSVELTAPDGTKQTYPFVNDSGSTTAGTVFIDNLRQDGQYILVESDNGGTYRMTGWSGTNCTLGSLATRTLNATVKAGSSRTLVNATCTFVNSIKKGSIKIVKDASPESNQSFAFTATGVSPTSFNLVDDGTNTQNSRTYSDLLPGTYSFAETGMSDWDLTNTICTDGSPVTAVVLSAGENITCTFTNVKRGNLVVQKTTLPAGDTTSFAINASATSGAVVGSASGSVTDANDYTYTVKPGTFSVNETVPSGWSETSNTCKDVAVGPGETKYCQITNTKLGSIEISKDAVPDSAELFNFTAMGTGVNNFMLDGDSDPAVPNSKSFSSLLPGDYTFTEQPTSGWDFDGITCTGATVTKVDATVTVHLAAGQVASCEYKNRMHGKLIVHKTTIPSGSQQTFAVSASSSDGGLLPGGSTGTVSDSQDAMFTIQQNKHYSVSETVPEGWTETSNSCSNLSINGSSTLVNGVPTVECTIINTQKASVTIVKQANPEGNTAFGFTGDFSSFNLVDDGTASNTKSFTNVLPNADYTVTESPTSGWYLSNLSCTGGSYKQGVSTASVVVTPKPGESITCTFSNTKYGSISGTKYEVNSNGGLVAPSNLGWTIFLDANGNGLFDDGEQSTTTDADGNYTFDNLVAGVYRVYEVLKSGWTQIFGDSTVTLGVGEDMTRLDFGNFKNVSISGHKWEDTNGDGKWQNPSESPLGGWTIQLKDKNGTILKSDITTEFDGLYAFSNIAPGTYTVCEVLQAGWVAMNPTSGCQDVTVSLSGVDITNVDFGNFKKAGISGYKFNDHNGDGTKDSGDEKLGGWTIQLKNAAGSVIATTTTDGNGYSFTGLTPGTYKVCEVQQANWTQTYPSGDGCHSFTVESGKTYTANFGNQGRGTLTVVKDVDDGFGKVTQDVSTWKWSYAGIKSGSNLSTGSTNDQGVPAGEYDVEEDLASQANYHFTNVSCTGAGNDAVTNAAKTSIKVGVGENVVCTFTNTHDTANITVSKVVHNNHGGTAVVGDFKLFVNQTAVTSGNPQSFLSGIQYTVSEVQLPGYELAKDGFTCTAASNPLVELGATFTLNYGDDVSCILTNQDIAPKLKVIKYVDHGLTNRTEEPSDFTMMVDGTNVSKDTFPGSGSGTEVTLNAGGYKVTEGAHDGYNVSYSEGCKGTLDVGDRAICKIWNIAIENPDIHVVKSGPTQAHEGDVVQYTFTVTNPGNVPFPAVDVEDDIAGVGSYVSGDSNDNGYLDPGETWVYTANYTIPEGQEVDVHNTVTVCGSYGYREESFVQSEGYKTVCDQDDHTLDVLHPGIHVVKEGPVNAQLGTVGTYTFTITNTGDTPLELTKVMDDIAGVGVYQSGDTNDNDLLDLDESWVFTANYQYTTVGTVTNTVEVCGVDEVEGEVCSEDHHDTIVYVPQVLGEETLVDTGARPWTATVIAVALMMAGGLTLLLGRRNATYLSKK